MSEVCHLTLKLFGLIGVKPQPAVKRGRNKLEETKKILGLKTRHLATVFYAVSATNKSEKKLGILVLAGNSVAPQVYKVKMNYTEAGFKQIKYTVYIQSTRSATN